MTRWSEIGGHDSAGDSADDYADRYKARFDRLAATGQDVHGEADFCGRLIPPGAGVLDAGCGTGRVAIELDRRGYRLVGVDIDERMLAVAGRAGPGVDWHQADLARFTPADLGRDEDFDLVLAAGNVIPLVRAGTESSVLANLAAALRPGGLLVAGFGLDAAHLPLPAPPFGLAEYDSWCAAAGLVPVARYAGWDGAPYPGAGGYAVSVHRSLAP